MLTADDVLVPMMRDEVEEILRARLSDVKVTCSGHQITAKLGAASHCVTVGKIDNVFADAQKLSDEIEDGLTQ